MAKIDHLLFSADQNALEEAYGKCPSCDGKLVVKYINKSSFLACQNYPSCKHTQHLQKNDVTVLKVMEGAECPKCKKSLAVKKGRYGMFIGCTGFPQCHFIANKDMVRTDGVVQVKKEGCAGVDGGNQKIRCPKCDNGYILRRQNKFGKYFYACDGYPKCKYMLNSLPLDIACLHCGWKVMLRMDKHSPEKGLVCPQATCQHKQRL